MRGLDCLKTKVDHLDMAGFIFDRWLPRYQAAPGGGSARDFSEFQHPLGGKTDLTWYSRVSHSI
jgi:hypothetical protein